MRRPGDRVAFFFPLMGAFDTPPELSSFRDSIVAADIPLS
jgi:hypothetical protein